MRTLEVERRTRPAMRGLGVLGGVLVAGDVRLVVLVFQQGRVGVLNVGGELNALERRRVAVAEHVLPRPPSLPCSCVVSILINCPTGAAAWPGGAGGGDERDRRLVVDVRHLVPGDGPGHLDVLSASCGGRTPRRGATSRGVPPTRVERTLRSLPSVNRLAGVAGTVLESVTSLCSSVSSSADGSVVIDAAGNSIRCSLFRFAYVQTVCHLPRSICVVARSTSSPIGAAGRPAASRCRGRG
jgi:hypothetical protein